MQQLSRAAQQPITLPLIDLSGQTHRQVIVDREAGQYLGHPTTVLLEDGCTILAVYPKAHGHGAIVMKRSEDGGLTWSERLPVPGNWATSQETPTIYRTVDPQGRRRLILFSGRFPVRLAVSEDDGRHWTPLTPIGDYGGTVAMADLVPLRDGSYMAVFHSLTRRSKPLEVPCACGAAATQVCGLCCWHEDRTATHYFCDTCGPCPRCGEPVMMPLDYTPRIAPDIKTRGIQKIISRDGGLTWSEPELITVHPIAHLCEPGAVRSPDGRTIALLLRENARLYNSFVIFSNDEGRTWTEPRELPGSLTGDRHQACYGPDGRLFISFRDHAHDRTTAPESCHAKTHGDWVAWVGTWDDLVQGREGQYRVRLMDNHEAEPGKDWDCGYPGVMALPDGTIVTTTYGHWSPGEAPYIVSVRLKLEELDEALRCVMASATPMPAQG